MHGQEVILVIKTNTNLIERTLSKRRTCKEKCLTVKRSILKQ